MNALDIWLIGVALAMDCFAASIATGVAAKRILLRPMTFMALMFGLFQGGMTVLGYLGMIQFQDRIEAYDHWIAFGLLTYLGLRMIWQDFRQEKPEAHEKRATDLLTPTSIFIMAIATSMDALAVGISIACMPDINLPAVIQYALIIAFCSLAFSIFGLTLGIRLSRLSNWHVEALGGIILIAIGIKILIEHTL